MGGTLKLERTLAAPPQEAWASLNRGQGGSFVGEGLLEGLRGEVQEDGDRKVVLLSGGGTLELELLEAFGDTLLTVRGVALPRRVASTLRRRLRPGTRRTLLATATATGVLATAMATAGAVASAWGPGLPLVVQRASSSALEAGVPVRIDLDGAPVSRLVASDGGWLALERGDAPPLLVDLGTMSVEALPSSERVRWAPGHGLLLTDGDAVDLLSDARLSEVSAHATDAIPHPRGGWVLAKDTELVWRHDGVVESLVSWAGPVHPLGVGPEGIWFEGSWAGQRQVGWVDSAGQVDQLPVGVRPLHTPVVGDYGAIWDEPGAVVHQDGRRIEGVPALTSAPALSPSGRWAAWPEGATLQLWDVSTGARASMEPRPGVPIASVSLGNLGEALVVGWVDEQGDVWAQLTRYH